jgi:hypothetical protein
MSFEGVRNIKEVEGMVVPFEIHSEISEWTPFGGRWVARNGIVPDAAALEELVEAFPPDETNGRFVRWTSKIPMANIKPIYLHPDEQWVRTYAIKE